MGWKKIEIILKPEEKIADKKAAFFAEWRGNFCWGELAEKLETDGEDNNRVVCSFMTCRFQFSPTSDFIAMPQVDMAHKSDFVHMDISGRYTRFATCHSPIFTF